MSGQKERDAGEGGHEGAEGELCFGPRTRDYCRDNEAKARFLPFQPRAETISRMTDCAIPLAAETARSASPRSHVVTED